MKLWQSAICVAIGFGVAKLAELSAPAAIGAIAWLGASYVLIVDKALSERDREIQRLRDILEPPLIYKGDE